MISILERSQHSRSGQNRHLRRGKLDFKAADEGALGAATSAQ